jgi:hypothetical protein
MNRRLWAFAGLLASLLAGPALAGDNEFSSAPNETEEKPFTFPGEFTLEQAYIGGSDAARGARDVSDYSEYYSNLVFVYGPRLKYGILRLGAQWERYSFGFPNGGQQLPNTLQAINAIVGFDTRLFDVVLVRFEAQPGVYGTSHLDGNSFNIPFVLGGTYIYSPDLQFIFGIGVNVQGRYPVLPGGGVRWKFAPQWVLNAALPAPRLEYQPNRSLTWFAGANIKANTFRTDSQFGDSHGDTGLNSAWLSYEEIRTGVGAEWKINSSISFTIEGGYVPWRQFDYYRTEVRYHNVSGAPYGAVMLHGAF